MARSGFIRPANLLMPFMILASSQFEGQTKAAPPPVGARDCFFVDGKALCGEEGRKARLEHENMVANLMQQQVQKNQKLTIMSCSRN